MKISSSKLSDELENPDARSMNVIFMGMSGAGKTYWARKFAQEYHYHHLEFDELIGHSQQVSHLVADFPGKDMSEKMGHYFGMPWTPGFQDREDMYLHIERDFMRRAPRGGALLDLTGSAIYHPEQLQDIASSGLVIYLQADKSSQEKMFENYRHNPKPVCWRRIYQIQPGETKEQALERCYNLLLESRMKMYEKYADVTLPFDVHKSARNAGDLVAAIQSKL